MAVDADTTLEHFAFASLDECRSVCNITHLEWCQNIEVGLRHFQCLTKSSHQCIETICRLAQACEDIYDEPTSAAEYCPTVFDGWACVNSTPAGQMAQLPCPAFDHFNWHPENSAYRQCSANGTWFDSTLQKPYTHYGACPDVDSFKCYDWVIKIYISGYAISILFLLLAIAIFGFFRRALRCVRNEIHTHLFVASILHNLSWLIWYGAVIYRMDTYTNWSVNEKYACVVLHVIIHYFMVATYMWMLCEGLYLFMVLAVTFLTEKKVKLLLYILGWFVPLIVILGYVIVRATFSTGEEMNIPCWHIDLAFNWMYKGPCIVSVFINLVFLCWIVYVLVSKFHADISDHAAMVKTAKAIALLVPLFGLHHFIAAFKPDDDETTRCIIEIISAVAISFQGMVVAVLFCLINNEVIMEIKKFFGQHLEQFNGPQSMAMTQYTVVPRNDQNGFGSPSQSSGAAAAGSKMEMAVLQSRPTTSSGLMENDGQVML